MTHRDLIFFSENENRDAEMIIRANCGIIAQSPYDSLTISCSPSSHVITRQYTVLLSNSSRGRNDVTKKGPESNGSRTYSVSALQMHLSVCVSIWGQTPLYHIPSGSMVSVNEMGKKRAVLYNHTLLRAQETRHRRVCLHSFSFPSMSRYLTVIHHAENIELNWYDINPPLRSP